jgi:hypothetical protein
VTHTMIPTHYLVEQEPSLIQEQVDGDGCCCCWQGRGVEREKIWSLQGHAKVDQDLGTPFLGLVGLET